MNKMIRKKKVKLKKRRSYKLKNLFQLQSYKTFLINTVFHKQTMHMVLKKYIQVKMVIKKVKQRKLN